MSTEQKPMAKAIATLSSLKPIQIPDHESVKKKFIQIFQAVHGVQDGTRIYEVEKFHFVKRMNEDINLQECTAISIYGAFIDLAAQGMSVDPSKKLGYLLWDNCKVGDNKYEKRARFQIQARGELAIRQQQGQILRADNPVIIYEGDHFRKYLNESGSLMIEYEAKFKSKKILGCFVRLVLPDGAIDYKHLDEVKIESLKAASNKKNFGKGANPNYTSCNGGIDPGFLETKCIKHAFTSYPKVKLKGSFSALETEIDNEEEINYDLDAPFTSLPDGVDHNTGEIMQTEETIQMTGKPSDPGNPVTVEDEEFDNF